MSITAPRHARHASSAAPRPARARLVFIALTALALGCDANGDAPGAASIGTPAATATPRVVVTSTPSGQPPPSAVLADDPQQSLFGGDVVAIEADGVRLTAELALPRGRAPHPAVLFLSGSGAQRRDGVQPPFHLRYDQIFRALVDAGFAVLAFDDRGSGDTPLGVPEAADVGYDRLADDAARAYRYLIRRPEIDENRVFLMGHSEGGLTALLLATHERRPLGVVLMSSPGRSIVDLSVDQALALLPTSADAATRAGAEARQREVLQAMLNGNIEGLAAPEADKRIMRAQARYLREIAKYDPGTLLAELRLPALIFQGGKDFQVRAERDGRRLAEQVEARLDSRYVLIEEADHLMWYEPQTSTIARYFEPGRDFHPDFLPALTGWLNGRLGR